MARIIDMHIHIHPMPTKENGLKMPEVYEAETRKDLSRLGIPPEDQAAEAVRRMDAAGVDAAIVVNPYQEPESGHIRTNKSVYETIAPYKGRLYALAGTYIHPTPDIKELETAITEYGFRGIKMNVGGARARPADFDLLDPLYKKLIELDVPALFHPGPGFTGGLPTFGYDIRDYYDLAKRHPELRIVIAHGGHGTIGGPELAPDHSSILPERLPRGFGIALPLVPESSVAVHKRRILARVHPQPALSGGWKAHARDGECLAKDGRDPQRVSGRDLQCRPRKDHVRYRSPVHRSLGHVGGSLPRCAHRPGVSRCRLGWDCRRSLPFELEIIALEGCDHEEGAGLRTARPAYRRVSRAGARGRARSRRRCSSPPSRRPTSTDTPCRHGRGGYPITISYTGSARVIEVGDGVITHKVGDLVYPNFYRSCGHCEACQDDRISHCEKLTPGQMQMMVSPEEESGLQDYVIFRAWRMRRVAPEASIENVALIGFASVAVHAVEELNLENGETVLINGAGPIGWAAIQAARNKGCRVVATEIDPARAALAEAVRRRRRRRRQCPRRCRARCVSPAAPTRSGSSKPPALWREAPWLSRSPAAGLTCRSWARPRIRFSSPRWSSAASRFTVSPEDRISRRLST